MTKVLSTADQLTVFQLAHENVSTLFEFLERLNLDYQLGYQGFDGLNESVLTDFINKLSEKTGHSIEYLFEELIDSYHLENFGKSVVSHDEEGLPILDDDNVVLPVDLDDDVLLKSNWMAVQKNITLNQMIVDAIVAEAQQVIDSSESK